MGYLIPSVQKDVDLYLGHQQRTATVVCYNVRFEWNSNFIRDGIEDRFSKPKKITLDLASVVCNTRLTFKQRCSGVLVSTFGRYFTMLIYVNVNSFFCVFTWNQMQLVRLRRFVLGDEQWKGTENAVCCIGNSNKSCCRTTIISVSMSFQMANWYFMHCFCSLFWNLAVSQRWSLTMAPGMSRPPAFITFAENLFRFNSDLFPLRPMNVSRLESLVKKPHGAFSLQWLENRSMVWWCQDLPRKYVGSCFELSQTQMYARNGETLINIVSNV